MKTLLTIMIAVFSIATTLGQTVVKKEIITLTGTQKGDAEKIIVELSKKLQKSIGDTDSLSKDDIKTLKELLTKITDTIDEDNNSKVTIKKEGSSKNSSISYSISLDSDEGVEILDLEDIDIEVIKEKLKDVSEDIHDSENIKMTIKTLSNNKVIIEEKEEKENKKQ